VLYRLKWLNIIHPSDLVAYPLKASLCLDKSDNLYLQDIYIDTTNNLIGKVTQMIGQEIVALPFNASSAHTNYWNSLRVAQLVVDHLQDQEYLGNKFIQYAIDWLQNVPGITVDQLKLHINDEPTTTLTFADGSGKLFHVINAARIHHVYLFDAMHLCRFAGYVGWLHSKHLEEAIAHIKYSWC
jgi:hypothetical protein